MEKALDFIINLSLNVTYISFVDIPLVVTNHMASHTYKEYERSMRNMIPSWAAASHKLLDTVEGRTQFFVRQLAVSAMNYESLACKW